MVSVLKTNNCIVRGCMLTAVSIIRNINYDIYKEVVDDIIKDIISSVEIVRGNVALHSKFKQGAYYLQTVLNIKYITKNSPLFDWIKDHKYSALDKSYEMFDQLLNDVIKTLPNIEYNYAIIADLNSYFRYLKGQTSTLAN